MYVFFFSYWHDRQSILFLFLFFFLENWSEVSTNYNTFKYSMLHVFRKYQLLVKILRTKLTRQVVYKVAFAMKYPHPTPNEHNLHTQIWSENYLSKNRIIRPNSHAKTYRPDFWKLGGVLYSLRCLQMARKSGQENRSV